MRGLRTRVRISARVSFFFFITFISQITQKRNMELYSISIETYDLVRNHHMDLLQIGLAHSCPMDPRAESEESYYSHYLCTQKEKGEALVKHLQGLDYIV